MLEIYNLLDIFIDLFTYLLILPAKWKKSVKEVDCEGEDLWAAGELEPLVHADLEHPLGDGEPHVRLDLPLHVGEVVRAGGHVPAHNCQLQTRKNKNITKHKTVRQTCFPSYVL